MKTQFKKDLQTKSVAEIKKLLDDAVKAVAGLKIDHQQNKLKSTRDIFHKRKEVAVLHSVMQVKKVVEKVAEAEKKVAKAVAKGGKK